MEQLSCKVALNFALTNLATNKDLKSKENFADNHFHNILRLFHILPNFPFTTSESIRDYY